MFSAVTRLRPFVIWHTAFSGESELVYELALRFPQIVFIVAHGGISDVLALDKWADGIAKDGPLENLWLDMALSWDPRPLYDGSTGSEGSRSLLHNAYCEALNGIDLTKVSTVAKPAAPL